MAFGGEVVGRAVSSKLKANHEQGSAHGICVSLCVLWRCQQAAKLAILAQDPGVVQQYVVHLLLHLNCVCLDVTRLTHGERAQCRRHSGDSRRQLQTSLHPHKRMRQQHWRHLRSLRGH